MKTTIKTTIKTTMKTDYLDELSRLPSPDTDFAGALFEQICNWFICARAYQKASGFAVGEDVELAPGWVAIGQGLRALLESPSASYPSRFGNLPRFELALLITDALEAQGYYAPEKRRE